MKTKIPPGLENGRQRTNLHLDNDALAFANFYAAAKGMTLGAAISELIRRAEQAPAPKSDKLIKKNGFLVIKSRGEVVTAEQVKKQLQELEDEETDGY